MHTKYYSTLLLASLALGACSQTGEPLELNKQEQQDDTYTVEFNGVFNMPEWVDLENEGRAFTLRPNAAGYPKIRLSGIEDNGADFEAFPSSVWLYNARDSYNFCIDVEDYGGAVHNVEGLNRNYGNSPARRGVSRIIKQGDRYHAFVKYEVSAKQGQPSYYANKGANYPNPYVSGTKAFVAFNYHRDEAGGSVHRLYMPKVHSVLSNSTGAPEMDDLWHVPGDFVVAEPSSTRAEGKRFKLPFISNYADLSTLVSGTKAITPTNFYMAGVLLALKFENQTGKPIQIHNIYTKSNNLCYSGYYELWKSHKDLSNNLPSATRTRPFFARADGGGGTKSRRNAVYTMGIKDENGNTYSLKAREKTKGRFYLWGGIDELKEGGSDTKLQVEYSFTSAPSTMIKTKVIDIAPRTAPNKFEEGKAYIITIPIK